MENDNTQNASSAQTENTQQTAENISQQSEEKKYTDTEMNNISKKNSEKAVNKLLKELGITDREKAKQILAQAAENEKSAQSRQQNESSRESQLASQLEEATKQAQNAVLENVFLTQSVKAEKISKAVKLIDMKDCLDENGIFSREKAQTVVTELLKEWPELIARNDNTQVGFKIGADTSSQNLSGVPQKKTVQKSWNKFNN